MPYMSYEDRETQNNLSEIIKNRNGFQEDQEHESPIKKEWRRSLWGYISRYGAGSLSPAVRSATEFYLDYERGSEKLPLHVRRQV
jgi:hypothetical protein